MWFKAFINASEIDLHVAEANDNAFEWYASENELIEDCGEGADIIEITLPYFYIEFECGHVMEFDDMLMN